MSGVFIRQSKGVAFDALLRRLSTSGPAGRALAEQASANLRTRAVAEMERQYKHLLDTVGAVLDDPGGHGLDNPFGGGTRTVRIDDAHGKPLTIRTENYDPLTVEYGKRKPFSFQYWNKHGRLKPPRRPMSLSRTYRAAVAGKGAVKASFSAIREQKVGARSRFRQRARFNPERLPMPLDLILRDSFISGKARDPLQTRRSYGRKSIGVIAYPEHFRPLLGQIAEQLSERAAEGLRQALTGLNK